MPANTPKYKWPYPVDGDAIADGAKAIENLARGIEKTIQSLPGGDGGTPGTPDPTALATVRRDKDGRAQVRGPVYPLDIATKQYVDGSVPTAITLAGSVPTKDDLPASAPNGTGYIVAADGHLWIRTGQGWKDAGAFQGPKGDTGAKGSTGDTGPKGTTGDTGVQGPKGEAGRDGGVQQDTLDTAIATRVANAAGQTNTIWVGSQGDYDALAAGVKNAAGFVAVIV